MRNLNELVPGIREHIRLGDQAVAKALSGGKLGELLLEAWPQLGEREWAYWLKINFGLRPATAYRYMRHAMQTRNRNAEDEI